MISEYSMGLACRGPSKTSKLETEVLREMKKHGKKCNQILKSQIIRLENPCSNEIVGVNQKEWIPSHELRNSVLEFKTG